jgi:hypothetical protein
MVARWDRISKTRFSFTHRLKVEGGSTPGEVIGNVMIGFLSSLSYR